MAGCGADTPPSSTDRIAAYVTRVAGVYGFELERNCVRSLIGGVPAADIELLLAASADGSPNPTLPELSTSGNALGSRLAECRVVVNNTNAALLDKALAAASTDLDGATLDQDCGRKALATFDDETLTRLADLAPGTTEPRLGAVTSALFGCLVFPGS